MMFDHRTIELIGLLALVGILLLGLYARAELIEPTNCNHLREGIAILEERMTVRGLTPSEIATLEYLRRWMDRERCDTSKPQKKVS